MSRNPVHKPIRDQVLVITGASSGIGLVTARMAARRGARVVLVSRDETDLAEAVRTIREAGGEADHVVADVADANALRAAADHAERRFGRIDTWVNNAGVSIYGRILEVSEDDARRLFETNYWGVVHGSLVAVDRLRTNGGVLVNVGSVLSDTAMPLQGHYTASKHAVKGFTDALRLELEHEALPVRVSLVKPAAIDTPYTEHARNYLEVQPTHAPPVYAPELVAEAILACAERGLRDVKVGEAAKLFTATETLSPRLGDRMKRGMFAQQRSDRPRQQTETLHAPRSGDIRERGGYEGTVFRRSPYSAAARRPDATTGTLIGMAALGIGFLAARSILASRDDDESRAPETRAPRLLTARVPDASRSRVPSPRGAHAP
jgi:short-subunit dehydrogenase